MSSQPKWDIHFIKASWALYSLKRLLLLWRVSVLHYISNVLPEKNFNFEKTWVGLLIIDWQAHKLDRTPQHTATCDLFQALPLLVSWLSMKHHNEIHIFHFIETQASSFNKFIQIPCTSYSSKWFSAKKCSPERRLWEKTPSRSCCCKSVHTLRDGPIHFLSKCFLVQWAELI